MVAYAMVYICKCSTWNSGRRAGLDKRAPPRAGQEQKVPAPEGLGRVVEGQWSEAELPFHGPSQSLGINKRAACGATMQASFVLARPLGINNRTALPRHLCPFIQPCPPARFPYQMSSLLVQNFPSILPIGRITHMDEVFRLVANQLVEGDFHIRFQYRSKDSHG